MAAAETLKIELLPEASGIVREAVESGRYRDPAEVVDEALKLWSRSKAMLDHLREAVREGADSGASIPADDLFAELEARYEGVAEADR